MKLIDKKLANLKAAQERGSYTLCPRCGRDTMKHPNTDAAEYKAYGNSVAVPCVFFILSGIVWASRKEESE